MTKPCPCYVFDVMRGEQSGWRAVARTVRGCHTQAATMEQLIERAREALSLFIDDKAGEAVDIVLIHIEPPVTLWLLRPTKKGDKLITWDSYVGHVVAARTEEEARGLCPSGDEGKTFWLASESSSCEYIGSGPATEPHVVLSSFNAG